MEVLRVDQALGQALAGDTLGDYRQQLIAGGWRSLECQLQRQAQLCD
jgi:hypothetical protein